MRKIRDFIVTVFVMSSCIKILQINFDELFQLSSISCWLGYMSRKKSYESWRILVSQCQVKFPKPGQSTEKQRSKP